MSEEILAEPATPSHEAAPPEVSEAPAETLAPTPEASAPPPEAEPPPEASDRSESEEVTYVLPEGVPQQVAEFAKQHDMTQKQLDGTLQYFGNIKQAELASIRTAGEAHVKNWGDKGQHNLNLARRALSQNDPDGELKTALDNSGFGNHPAVLNFLHRLGTSMQEGGFLKSAVNRPPGQKSAAQAMYGGNHPSNE